MSVKKQFTGKIKMIGCGCVGQALLPLLARHLRIPASRIAVVAADALGRDVAEQYAGSFSLKSLYPDNYTEHLADLTTGDLLLNLSVDVSSYALADWCQQHGVLYLDTCVEPWEGGYREEGMTSTNAYLRQQILTLGGKSTAVVAHGANPGLVSHFVKQSLALLGAQHGQSGSASAIANSLGVRVIQIAEIDTQRGAEVYDPNVFFNTWSPPGFLSEAFQKGELGWGTHELGVPSEAQSVEGVDYGIVANMPSCDLRVKSWTPLAQEQEAFLITHHEALSLASFLQAPDGRYRPTVYYAYKPCALAEKWLSSWKERGYEMPEATRGLTTSLVEGVDELGVLLMGDFGAFWMGSTLSLAEARAIAPYNTATTLQVVGGILGAITWMLENPEAGVVEAENMDSDIVLEVATPYLGKFWHTYVDKLWHVNEHSQKYRDTFVMNNFWCNP